MKKTSHVLLLLMVLSLQACADSDKKLILENSEQRLSYGLAYLTGKDLVKRGMIVDAEAYAAGIRDAVADKNPQITEEEIRAEMISFQEKMRVRQEEGEVMVAEKNQKEGAEFLKNNSEKESINVTSSGLQYEVIEAGDGDSPTAEDTVEVHYRGTLLDGTVFDSSYQRNQPIEFDIGLGQVIPGWDEGIMLLNKGAGARFVIPSNLAYGSRGAGGIIPPNSTLIFEVELLNF